MDSHDVERERRDCNDISCHPFPDLQISAMGSHQQRLIVDFYYFPISPKPTGIISCLELLPCCAAPHGILYGSLTRLCSGFLRQMTLNLAASLFEASAQILIVSPILWLHRLSFYSLSARNIFHCTI
ncbi:hypothetical protein BDZ89DRAFT_281481 [Hymenopellis radicata]|nr:hypothetical protein BDZ89DRAFT_281481 [Hymenopellis radicata]